jgi:high-affinity iron transporter
MSHYGCDRTLGTLNLMRETKLGNASMNALSIALQSASILLREGLEALLVIAALAAFLNRAGVPEKVRSLYIGAGVAIIASIGAAVVFEMFFEGNHNDYVESAVLTVAAILMLYMSGWMYLRQDPRTWLKELRGHAERALNSGAVISLGAIAFLAVFREGGETVLFLHALAASSGGWGIGVMSGLLGAALGLVVIYYAMQRLSAMLPLRPVFLVTSAFLFIMGVRFAGAALQEMQERTVISYTPATLPDWLVSLGFNPSWEAIAAQFLIAAIAVGSIFVIQLRKLSSAVATK